MSASFRLAPKPAAAATKPVAAANPKPVAAATAIVAKAPKISDIVKQLLAKEAITTKAHLDTWCGEAGRETLYAYVRVQAPEHWDRVVDPKAATRGAYQSLLAGYGDEASSASDEGEEAFGARIRTCGEAEALIGKVCTYNTAEGREYGRILRATASEIILERLSMAGGGVFVLHPVPVCPRSRNHVAYSRKICLVAEPPKAMGGAGSPPVTPLASPPASPLASPPASPPASPAAAPTPPPEALALKLAEELVEAQRREIARLIAVEGEFLSLKTKLEVARLKRKEAFKARAKRTDGAPKAAADGDKSKDIMDVFDFFPELVEELASEDPVHLG